MARKYKNETERQYFRERDRIRKALERMEQRGIIQQGAMSNKSIMPQIPKKITQASVRRLERMTTQSLYKNAELVDLDTGEILARGADIKRVERERKRAKRESKEYIPTTRSAPKPKVSTAQLIIDNLKDDIRRMNSPLIPYMLAELQAVQGKIGAKGLAKTIETSAAELHDIIDRGTGAYKSKVVDAIARRFDRIIFQGMSRMAVDDVQDDPRIMTAAINLRTAADVGEWIDDGEE